METRDEWEFIRDQIQHLTTNKNEWHIGLEKTNRTWTWVSGTTLKADCEEKGCWPWQPGQPTEEKEEVALVAKNYPKGTKGLFNNIEKKEKRGFICELATG